MAPRRALVALLATGAAAYPKLLQCASDDATRLQPGATVMGAPVQGCYSGAACPVDVSVAAAAAGATTFRVNTTTPMDFVVRVADGAGKLSTDHPLLTAKCDTQLYSSPGGTAPAAAGSYDVTFTPAAGYTAATAGLTVGYAAPPTKGGIAVTPKVTVMTYPPTPAPAPAPKPAHVATMSLDTKACRGAGGGYAAAAGGNYTLRVTAKGAKGYAYTCDSTYDTAAEAADKECAGWLPAQVVDGKENLDITLEALDSTGKVAVCMQWHLAFDGAERAGSWHPAEASPAAVLAARARLDGLLRAQARAGGGGPTENDAATRHLATEAYLDSMTTVSHRCVPKAQNDLLYSGILGCTAFPPQAKSEIQFLLSHELLAVSGTIHSIDRKCTEAWDIPIPGVKGGGSCVPTIPGFPHCHTSCQMTWNLGPGGIATWGMSLLNHHIPSPTLALGQYDRADVTATYNDVGCGGK